MSEREQGFENRRVLFECSCGETLLAILTIEEGTTTTLGAIQDAWFEEHPDGDYVHSQFHAHLPGGTSEK